jgi:hypothetical protein
MGRFFGSPGDADGSIARVLPSSPQHHGERSVRVLDSEVLHARCEYLAKPGPATVFSFLDVVPVRKRPQQSRGP